MGVQRREGVLGALKVKIWAGEEREREGKLKIKGGEGS